MEVVEAVAVAAVAAMAACMEAGEVDTITDSPRLLQQFPSPARRRCPYPVAASLTRLLWAISRPVRGTTLLFGSPCRLGHLYRRGAAAAGEAGLDLPLEGTSGALRSERACGPAD